MGALSRRRCSIILTTGVIASSWAEKEGEGRGIGGGGNQQIVGRERWSLNEQLGSTTHGGDQQALWLEKSGSST